MEWTELGRQCQVTDCQLKHCLLLVKISVKTTFDPTETDRIPNFKMGSRLLYGAHCSAQKLVSSMGLWVKVVD